MPTPPNTSAVLSENEIDFINEYFHGSKSAAIHAGLRILMSMYAHGGWADWSDSIRSVAHEAGGTSIESVDRAGEGEMSAILFRVNGHGPTLPLYGISTNAGPVWESEDGFADLLEEYGLTLP